MTTTINDVLSAWSTAERTGDTRALESLLADDFVGVGPVGFVLDKSGWVGRFEHGLRYEQLDLDELAIRHHGDTAVVVAHQHAVGDAGGTPVPTDTRVSFTVVTDAGGEPTIAGMQYSFIGPPLGGPR
jgi:ketosteroid isomerase-like protein